MGGYEAGEVAAALTIQVLRQQLLAQKPFAALGGGSTFGDPLASVDPAEGHARNAGRARTGIRTTVGRGTRLVRRANNRTGHRRDIAAAEPTRRQAEVEVAA